MLSIEKLCANHLRTYSSKQGVKLKSSHAHELVAAFFGYKSQAAMLSDKLCPIHNLSKAKIFVLMPSAFIDERRKCLDDLPPELPDTYTLAEEMFVALISERRLSFRSFGTWSNLAEVLYEEYLQKQGGLILPSHLWPNEKIRNIFNRPLYQYTPKLELSDTRLKLIVLNRYYRSVDVLFQPIDVTCEITLDRVAGHVGYANPEISIISIADQSVEQPGVI